MNDTLAALKDALDEKRVNRAAHDAIVRWLSEDEYAEYRDELATRIDQKEWDFLMDAFYKTVIFGTGGIRGLMDIGTNRINNATIRWASQAYAQYLKKHEPGLVDRGIAIAYDSRHHSEEYMRETARVLAANGIPVHIFPYYRATPELSFAVRHLSLAGGIVITASHNPPVYNGYKVYDAKGIQLLPEAGHRIEAEFFAVTEIRKMTFEDAITSGLVTEIGAEVDEAFAESARAVSVFDGRDVRIAFSPLHGVGSQSVLPVLTALGFSQIAVVEEQTSLDGDFPTVPDRFPNPEFPVIYRQVLALAKETDADIALVSDPDADRLGIAVPDGDAWRVLTGNQAAAMLAAFFFARLAEQQRLPAHPVVIKTSVTTELLRDIAEAHGAEVIGDLLVGFKFIGDCQERLPAEKTFAFACEESMGYNFSRDYRDKGAETPAVVAAEMAAWCKTNDTTPLGLLEDAYKKHGYYAERLYYRLIEGIGAFDRMNAAMHELRARLPKELAGIPVRKVMDRLTGEVRDGQTGALLETRAWDKGDMISFFLSDDERSAVHVRPSGNEPKMKYYTMMRGDLGTHSKKELEQTAEAVERDMATAFEGILDVTKIDLFS